MILISSLEVSECHHQIKISNLTTMTIYIAFSDSAKRRSLGMF